MFARERLYRSPFDLGEIYESETMRRLLRRLLYAARGDERLGFDATRAINRRRSFDLFEESVSPDAQGRVRAELPSADGNVHSRTERRTRLRFPASENSSLHRV